MSTTAPSGSTSTRSTGSGLPRSVTASTRRYHWTDIGPFVAGAGAGAGIAGEEQHWRHSEASIARAGDAWVICSRASTADREGDHATGWVYTADPFADVAGSRLLHDPPTTVPRTLYA